MIKVRAIFTILMLFTGYSNQAYSADQWTGIVYPDKENLFEHKIIGKFKTKKSCLIKAIKQAKKKGAYECAKNCAEGTLPMICEESVGNEKKKTEVNTGTFDPEKYLAKEDSKTSDTLEKVEKIRAARKLNEKVYICFPHTKIESSSDFFSTFKLNSNDSTKNILTISNSSESLSKAIIESRDNLLVDVTYSGIFDVYSGAGITVKINPITGEYFEFVHMMLSTITYYGSCK